ncbi:hypothetical protein [uncultured Psychroserpens sp.]|uniref:hypothetical protein n=1 Tax=uncultured Psychroserpens sp. TaxID=255436 RepID=UPI00260D1608|nr:hypothetical protein [uncultured Psychroserpens sp.]
MKAIILYLFLFLSALSFSQDNAQGNAWRYRSFSINPILGYYSDFNGNTFGKAVESYKDFNDTGITIGADVTFSYLEKHLLTLSLYSGTEFNILGTSNGIDQINLFYGRMIPISRTVFFEAHLGAGYFRFNSRHIDNESRRQTSKSTIGFPIMTKFRVMTGKRFSLGVMAQINFNSIKSFYNVGLILQWNKKR